LSRFSSILLFLGASTSARKSQKSASVERVWRFLGLEKREAPLLKYGSQI
jgi:hypothetical protein